MKGYHDQHCNRCGAPLAPSPLLFPIREKQYTADPLIASEWEVVQAFIECAYILTIIGYSAPVSDVNARRLLKEAWRKNGTTDFAQVEIVDVKPERQVMSSWSDFVVRNNYGVRRNARRGLAFWYPRRSCDAFAWATLQQDPWRDRKLPRFRKVSSLQGWLAELMNEELMYDRDGTPLKKF